MKIEFSDHSIEQLKIRSRITKQLVVGAIQNPTETIPSFRGRVLYRREYSGEVLEVVTVQEDDKITVITEYFLDR